MKSIDPKNTNTTHQKTEKLSTKKGIFALGAKVTNLYLYSFTAELSKHQRTNAPRNRIIRNNYH